jgi:uncharacterized membrane protein YhhN
VNGASYLLVAMVAAAAFGNWIAVHQENRNLEYICKPLTTLLLIGLATTIEPEHSGTRTWFVVALAFSLVGDVCLMLPKDLFLAGLGSFFAAHVAYVVGLMLDGVGIGRLLTGIVVVAVAILAIGTRLVAAVSDKEHDLIVPVMAYIGAISAMVISAVGTGQSLAIAGAVLFYASDSILGWSRFVREHTHSRLAIMVTYHLAQLALVLSLV